MRPIDADALVERICGEHCGCHRSQCGYSMLDDGYDACSRVEEIEAAPTLFKNAGPGCMTRKGCPEGKRSCGSPRKEV